MRPDTKAQVIYAAATLAAFIIIALVIWAAAYRSDADKRCATLGPNWVYAEIGKCQMFTETTVPMP